MFELRRCPSYGVSSNGELLMRIYLEIFTVPEESFELRRGSSYRRSSYRESTVLKFCLDFFCHIEKNGLIIKIRLISKFVTSQPG